MDYRKNKNTDPWDDGVFGTGNTMPPKSHGSIIALLLIMVIFLSGIVSALSFLNIKLFQQLNRQKEQLESAPMSFSDLEHADPATEPTHTGPRMPVQEDVSLVLNQSPQSVENIPQEGALSWQDIYEKNIGSVVSILSSTDSGSVTGAGVIISEKGYIVTNCHVVDGAETITIQFTDGRSLTAVVIGADALTDLAVLYVDAADLQAAEFGNSDSLRVGDPVAAIGDPLGTELRGSLTDGIISAINRDILLNGQAISLIQTSAAVNAGNSGGPLINCYGQVVGINTTRIGTFADSDQVEGLSFAIPSTTVKEIVDQLMSQGYVSGRPTLGILGDSISQFDQYYFQIPAGLYIEDVQETSDAFAQGIEPGDILLSVDGIAVTTQGELDAIVYTHQIGDTVSVILYRAGQQQVLSLTLTEDVG